MTIYTCIFSLLRYIMNCSLIFSSIKEYITWPSFYSNLLYITSHNKKFSEIRQRYIGYSAGYKGWRLWDRVSQGTNNRIPDRKVSRLSVSRVAVFEEMNSTVGGITVCIILCRKQCLRESGVNIRVRAEVWIGRLFNTREMPEGSNTAGKT